MKIGTKLLLGLLILAVLVEITGLVAILSMDKITDKNDPGTIKEKTIYVIIFLIFMGFFVSIAMGIFLSYSIIRPIKKLTSVVLITFKH